MIGRTFAFPPKKILVALDLTPASEAAWRCAKSLGAALGASVHGLYVREALVCPEPPLAAERAATVRDLRRKLGAGEHEIVSAVGKAAALVANWASRLDFDLIVTGTHGRAGLGRLVHGSVAAEIARRAAVPVLVTRKPADRIVEALAPVHFQPYAREGARRAAELCAALGASLTLLHVVDAPLYGDSGSLNGARHLLRGLADELSGVRGLKRPRGLLAFGEPAGEIARAAQGRDLVVLVSRLRGLLDDGSLGTTVDRVLRRGGCAVLALPAAAVRPERRARPRLAAAA